MKKKGQVGGLSGSVVALGIAAIALILMLVILEDMRDTDMLLTGAVGCNATSTATCEEAFQAANDTLVGLATFSDFWTIIVLAIVAAVVIAVIFGAFGRAAR